MKTEDLQGSGGSNPSPSARTWGRAPKSARPHVLMEMMIRTGAQGQHAFCSDDARLFGRSPAEGTPQAGFRPYPSPSAKAKARQKAAPFACRHERRSDRAFSSLLYHGDHDDENFIKNPATPPDFFIRSAQSFLLSALPDFPLLLTKSVPLLPFRFPTASGPQDPPRRASSAEICGTEKRTGPP